MLELQDSTGILERAVRLTLSSAFQLTQDADGLALLNVSPGAFLTQAAADLRYGQLAAANTWTQSNIFTLAVRSNSNVRAGNTGEGWVQLTSGGASNIGYVEWYTAANVRQGYFGFGASGLGLNVEVGNFTINTGPNFAVLLSNSTAAWIQWPNAGVGAPTTTTRSVGTKLLLNPQLSGSAVDYALGIESSFMWFSVPTSGGWKWYVNTSAMAILTSAGSFNIAGSFVGAAITVGAATPAAIVLTGAPTNVQQIFLGDSSVAGAVGTMFSSGAAFQTFNAYQNTYNSDSWTQRLGSSRSIMMELGVNGFALYTAAVGKATAAKATFWGTSVAYVSPSGGIGGIGQLRMGSQAGSNGIDGDVIAARGTTTGAYYYGNASGAYTYFDGTWLNLGGAFAGLVMGDYSVGLVGVYDSTKYRSVYSIGTGFTPPAGGAGLGSSYGLTFFYDATSGTGFNISGFTFGHALGLVNGGIITCLMGANGFWTAGNIRAGGGLVVTGQITGGSMLITGASTLGSATIGGYAVPAVRSGSASSIPGDLVAGQMYFGY
jgi:hypothetical protein